MSGLQFNFADILTGRIVGSVEPKEFSFTDPVTGSGIGELVIPIPHDPQKVRLIRAHTSPLRAQVVIWDHRGRVLFGGPVLSRDPGGGELKVGFVDWRWWFYQAVLDRMGHALVNSDGDYLRHEPRIEQVDAMADLARLALAETGAPSIIVPGAPATDIKRQVTLRRFGKFGDRLDNISRRDSAPEWWVEMRIRTNDERFVDAIFRTPWPERASRKDPILAEHSSSTTAEWTVQGGNLIAEPAWVEDASERAARVIALGEGEPPDQVSAMDEDPELEDGGILLTERVVGPFDGVVETDTAWDHAHAERRFREAPMQSIDLELRADNPPVGDYATGDRAHVVIRTDWLDVDVPAARILSRTISGGRGRATTVTITVNMNDIDPPSEPEEVPDVPDEEGGEV